MRGLFHGVRIHIPSQRIITYAAILTHSSAGNEICEPLRMRHCLSWHHVPPRSRRSRSTIVKLISICPAALDLNYPGPCPLPSPPSACHGAWPRVDAQSLARSYPGTGRYPAVDFDSVPNGYPLGLRHRAGGEIMPGSRACLLASSAARAVYSGCGVSRGSRCPSAFAR
jgi:hypothetical protein